MTTSRQTSTIQSPKFNQQQVSGNHQHDKLVLASQGIDTNKQKLNTHTDLILTLTKVATNAATQEHTDELKGLMLKALKANLQMYDLVLSMQATTASSN